MRIFLIFLLFPFVTFAQLDSGYVHFFIYPDQCKVIINDSLIVKTKSKIMLPQGIHNIKITGDKLKSVNENFKVTKDSTVIYRKIMGYSDAYNSYKSEMIEYRFKKSTTIFSASVLAGITLYLTYNLTIQTINKQNAAYENALFHKNAYQNSYTPTDLALHKSNFYKYKDEYYKYRRQKYNAIPISIIGSFITYKVYKYNQSIKKPKYMEPLSVNYNIINQQIFLSYEF